MGVWSVRSYGVAAMEVNNSTAMKSNRTGKLKRDFMHPPETIELMYSALMKYYKLKQSAGKHRPL
jgi:hypothetical protein